MIVIRNFIKSWFQLPDRPQRAQRQILGGWQHTARNFQRQVWHPADGRRRRHPKRLSGRAVGPQNQAGQADHPGRRLDCHPPRGPRHPYPKGAHKQGGAGVNS